MSEINDLSIVTLAFFFLSTIFTKITVGLMTVPILATIILWASQCIGATKICNDIVGTDGVAPYNILILFIPLVYMSVTLDVIGILQAAAFWTPISSLGPPSLSTIPLLPVSNWLISEFAAATAYTILPFIACNLPGYAAGRSRSDKAEKDRDADGGEKTPSLILTTSSPKPPAMPIPPLIVSDMVLGYGSRSTVVYQGSFQGRAVAVKRLLQDFVSLATNEVSILQQSDDHPKAIRYHYQESHPNFFYIALELCPDSLADIVENPHGGGILGGNRRKEGWREIASTWPWVDSSGYQTSDLSTGDDLSSRGSVATVNGTPPGTTTTTKTRLTKSVDIFALGCLFYYALTNGGHPYGDRFEREGNIFKDNKQQLSLLPNFCSTEESEAQDLITQMFHPQPSRRPDTKTCLLHPFFWDPTKRLGFLQETSDRSEVINLGDAALDYIGEGR
ncbi:kinase-like protein [Phlegmacium glaucopus]|nr:kinase-like protein [Phlegmacium glaucopus]